MYYSLRTGPGDVRSAVTASEALTAMVKEWLS